MAPPAPLLETVVREILLINVTGEDKPGITSAVTEVLADYNVNVLDIGQAVIHDSLNLGILAEVRNGEGSAPVLKDMLFRMQDLGMQVRFNPISEDSYAHWVSQQGKPRHIITLLARQITAQHIASITSLTADSGLNIDKITRLSGRVPLDHAASDAKACVEFSLRGAHADLPSLRAKLVDIASTMDADIAFQEDSLYRRNRRLVVFDMDSTLIEAEVIDELAVAAGVGEQVSAITEAAMRGEIDFKESFRRRLSLLTGLDAAVLEDIAASLKLTEGTERLLAILKKLGYKTAIVSGGFTYFGHYLQARLGFDYVFANELDIRDGRVTGEVAGEIIDGQRKAQLLRELAERENISLEQVIAVGDGANDLPMLSIAGLGIAFRAKPIVRASAKQAISCLGLDSILYLMGFSDRDTGLD